jgi:hypothetical protein
VSISAAKDIPASPPGFQPFEEAVKQYLELRHDLQKKVPKLHDKATPEQIAAHKRSIAQAIRSARADARPGDIFVPTVREQFLHAIRSETRGAAGKPARETIKGENPKAPGVPGDVKLAVNATYPSDAPATTLPPDLLGRLPTLPEGLEYRFVGRALIIRDVDAALIVDYLPNALPGGPGA